ncbi:copper ABC transporter ATP-binding protein [Duganella caerulea]|uniref:ABC transporter ATP-binding protein n=1 Tax=Duganella caerulea TaxID=2885762 RepID=UPI0030E81AFE
MTSTHVEPAGAAVSLAGVGQRFGAVTALHEVTLDIARGEMFGLIGHNGAGKSTLFKLMLGLITPSSGTLHVLGQRTSAPAFRQARRRIGYLPENFVTYDNLSGREVLQLFADLKRVPRAACPALLEQVGLAGAADRPVHGYSKGMRQRLGLAQALLGEPDLIFLDEPTNGLDPQGIADFYAILRAVRARGATIVITSHILAEIQDRVDRLVIMHGGRIAAQGTLAQLRSGMALRLGVVATVAEADQTAAVAALAALPGDASGAPTLEREGTRFDVRCAAADKLAVLAALLPHARDIALHEPTLEQVFLGYGGAYASSH